MRNYKYRRARVISLGTLEELETKLKPTTKVAEATESDLTSLTKIAEKLSEVAKLPATQRPSRLTYEELWQHVKKFK